MDNEKERITMKITIERGNKLLDRKNFEHNYLKDDHVCVNKKELLNKNRFLNSKLQV